MRTYTLTVTTEVAQTILNSLAERPYREVANAMSVVNNQISIQNKETDKSQDKE